MLSEKITSSVILGVCILVSSFIFSERNGNDFEFVRDIGKESRHGFSILNNKKTGYSCLLREGAVDTVTNWEEMAKQYSVPRQLCKGV